MPILRVPDSDEPLQQGDVLKGVKLFATGGDWEKTGGSYEELTASLSMVVSRPCVIEHKPQIVVAAIESRTDGVPSTVQSFEDAKAFLCDLRDGVSRPDRFYLGQIPDESPGRYYAKLDSLHTVALPDPADSKRLIPTHRIAVLAEEFIRDLHMRIFGAFANLGFDDVGWHSDDDLRWLIDKGEHALQSARTSMLGTKAKKSELEAAGPMDSGQRSGLENRIAKQNQEVADLEIEVNQLKHELDRRSAKID